MTLLVVVWLIEACIPWGLGDSKSTTARGVCPHTRMLGYGPRELTHEVEGTGEIMSVGMREQKNLRVN